MKTEVLLVDADEELTKLAADLIKFDFRLPNMKFAAHFPEAGASPFTERLKKAKLSLARICHLKRIKGQYNSDKNFRQWLYVQRKSLKNVVRMLEGIKFRILYSTMKIIGALHYDLRDLYPRIAHLFGDAFDIIRDEFEPCDKLWKDEWEKDFIENQAKYMRLKLQEHIFPDLWSLAEAGVIQRISNYFQTFLQSWDETHRVDAPATRRVLVAFAYQLEKNYYEKKKLGVTFNPQ